MVIWQMPHFYAIAIRKKEDYAAANIPMLPVVKGEARTYLQSNVYLVLLILSGLLFWPLSPGLTFVTMILSGIWLWMSLTASKKEDQIKWANKMFGFSLVHMMVIFGTVFIYATIGLILKAL
jgi:protoheme IX farnesyltransferase